MAKTTIPAGYIAANAITATELAANSVTAAAIATDAISADIADNAITAAKIAKNAVGSSEIATNAVGADQISPNAVKASELASDALSGQNFTGNVTFDTNVLYVDSSNNRVGIGTTSPSVALQVHDSLGTTLDDGVLRLIDDTSYAQNVGAALALGFKYNSSGNVVQRGGVIKAIKENATDGNYASALLFGTAANGANTTERMRIDSLGNVGVGLTPSGYLTSGYKMRLYDGTQSYISFNNSTYSTQVIGGFVIGFDGAARLIQRENLPMTFYTNNTEHMRIEGSGNVGIGTTSPSLGKLQIEASSFSGYAGRFNNSGTGGGNHGLYVNTNSSSAYLSIFGVGGDTKHYLSGDLVYFKGDIGVGANPSTSYKLNIVDDVSETYTQPDGTSDTGLPSAVLRVRNKNAGNGNHATIQFSAEPATGNEARGFIGLESVSGGDDGNMFLGLRVGTNAHQTRTHWSEHAVEGPMFRANAWWNGAMGTPGGQALELGFVGAYGYVLGYDRNASQYKNVGIDGYTIGFATSGTFRAELLNDGFHPYADSTYTLGQETGNSWKQLFLKHSANTGESNGEPDMGKTTTGGIHFTNNGASTSTGITWEGGDSNTQAGIVCHHNNSNGTHLGFFTTNTYSGGPYCRMKLTNYGTLVLGVATDIGGVVNPPTTSSLHSNYGDIVCNASNNNIMLSDLLPGYSRNAYGTIKSSANYIYFSIGNSYVSNINTSGTYSASDARLKTNVATITGALDKVNQLRGVTFNWIDETRGTDTNIGMIAQEVETVVPELVDNGAGLPDDDEGNAPMKGVNYAHMTSLLVEAIKELKTENDALKARVEALEG